jgi:hypothetical protein
VTWELCPEGCGLHHRPGGPALHDPSWLASERERLQKELVALAMLAIDVGLGNSSGVGNLRPEMLAAPPRLDFEPEAPTNLVGTRWRRVSPRTTFHDCTFTVTGEDPDYCEVQFDDGRYAHYTRRGFYDGAHIRLPRLPDPPDAHQETLP